MQPRSVPAWAAGVMLGLGVLLWLAAGRGLADWNEQLPALAAPIVALALVAVPSVRRVGGEVLRRIDAPSPRRRALGACGIAVVAAIYFVLTAYLQGRYFGPVWHDELSYLTQTHILARGRMWMPPHELAEFFDSFYMLQRPVYASMYFPGTALLYTPTAWLGLPSWLMPVLAAGAVVGLAYRIITELAGGVAGALAALLLVSLQSFRLLSVMFMSQVPVMLLGLLMVWAYLRWREGRRDFWAAAIGFFAGWSAITRPIDALCFAVPVGLAVLIDQISFPARRTLVTLLLLLAGAAPFLGLQLVANRGVTGKWLTTPWALYVQRDFPQTQMGFRPLDPDVRPGSTSAHKRLFYERQVRGLLQDHTLASAPRTFWRHRLPTTLASTLPHASLVVLLPIGLLACSRRRWVMAAASPLFIVLYTPSVFFTRYYPVVAAPAAILLVVLGIEALAGAFPRRRDALRLFLVLAMASLALCCLPEARRLASDEAFEPRLARTLERAVHEHVRAPAVVLIRFSPARNLDEQSVANPRVAWPDDAPVIRAHDLGPRNVELFRYYASRQPRREVYLFDEQDGALRRLGVVTDLAASPSEREH